MKHKTAKRFGTFNCQGLLNPTKLTMLKNDFEKYQLHILTIQEIHMKGTGIVTLKSNNNKNLNLFYSGHEEKSINGVGIIVSSNHKSNFKPVVSDRI